MLYYTTGVLIRQKLTALMVEVSESLVLLLNHGNKNLKNDVKFDICVLDNPKGFAMPSLNSGVDLKVGPGELNYQCTDEEQKILRTQRACMAMAVSQQ